MMEERVRSTVTKVIAAVDGAAAPFRRVLCPGPLFSVGVPMAYTPHPSRRTHRHPLV